jgi:hypothetical protein
MRITVSLIVNLAVSGTSIPKNLEVYFYPGSEKAGQAPP